QADPVRMRATAVASFEGEAPDAVEDRLVLVDLNPERHVRAMAHHEVGTHVNRRVGNLYLVIQHLVLQAPVMAGDDRVCPAAERRSLYPHGIAPVQRGPPRSRSLAACRDGSRFGAIRSGAGTPYAP